MSNPRWYKLTRADVAGMIAFLMAKPRTKPQLAKLIGVSRDTAGGWLNALHAEGCVHIKGYVLTRSNGYRAAVYAWGPGEDAVKPRPATSSERARKCMNKATLDRAWQGVSV
jgi:predicted transcriptional regulator